jgi:hypothetical protein
MHKNLNLNGTKIRSAQRSVVVEGLCDVVISDLELVRMRRVHIATHWMDHKVNATRKDVELGPSQNIAIHPGPVRTGTPGSPQIGRGGEVESGHVRRTSDTHCIILYPTIYI